MDDLDAMAASAVHLLTDRVAHEAMAQRARWAVTHRFCVDMIVPLYERLYQDLCARKAQGLGYHC
jgi:hypothetical protein